MTFYPLNGSISSKPESLDFEFHKLLKRFTHPYRWAIEHPSYGASGDKIQKGLSGIQPKNGGAKMLTPHGLLRCRTKEQRLYVTSCGTEGGILTLDADAHQSWQSLADAQNTIEIIRWEWFYAFGTHLPIFSYASSPQGQHGTIWVDYGPHPLATIKGVYDDLQAAVTNALVCYQSPIATSMEVKGQPVHFGQDGTLNCGIFTRLPVDAWWWDSSWLQALGWQAPVYIERLRDFAQFLRNKYLPYSQPSIQPSGSPSPPSQAILGTATATGPNVATQPAIVGQGSVTGQSPQVGQPAVFYARVVALRLEPNSFVRRQTALLLYARQLRRVPTLNEALDFLFNNRLFTGNWADNEERRKISVDQILPFIAQTFDPSKTVCKNGLALDADKLNQMRAYVRQHYTDGLPPIPNRKKQRISEDSIAVFLHLTQVCVWDDPNPDASVPRNRFEALWELLRKNKLVVVKWNRHYWKSLREFFSEVHTLIEVFDDTYAPGKAMKWRLTPQFPLADS